MNTIKKWIFINLIISCPIIATADWPTFNVPAPADVLKLVKTEGCLLDQAKMPVGTAIPIQSTQNNWAWNYIGLDSCEAMPDDPIALKYVAFQQTGTKTGGQITVGYGTDAQHVLYQFQFIIPKCNWGSDCEWTCAPLAPGELPTRIGCAYDSTN